MTKYWVKSKIWSLQHQAEFEPGAEVELDGDMAELVADGVLQEIDPAQPGDIAVVDDAVPNDLPADIAESGDGSGRRKKKIND